MVFQETIKCEINDFVAIVTIDNPPLNALNCHVMDGLRECFTALSQNDSIRAVVITGEGKAFVAGADIKEFTGWTPEEAEKVGRKGYEIFNMIENLPVPTIAAINGFAFGGGLELALVCDIRIASEKAKLGLPEASLGINPGYGGLARLAKIINIAQAKKMIFTADHIDAEAAKAVGLVQEVLPVNELMGRAMEIAIKISNNAPIAIKEIKKTINAARSRSIEEALELEVRASVACYATEDKIEGVDAFINKRKPVFNNK
jgi:enoyl-CoA hydratase